MTNCGTDATHPAGYVSYTCHVILLKLFCRMPLFVICLSFVAVLG